MDLRWGILAGYGPLFLEGLWTTITLTIVHRRRPAARRVARADQQLARAPQPRRHCSRCH
jgi:hypothetical protein